MPWPATLAGRRCLDVGTLDGFWAFEMERRGAADVVAVDLPDPPRPSRFAEAGERLGSRARHLARDVMDLHPGDVGRFDLVMVGYVLQMVRDPVGALAAVRSVCRGHVVALDTVSAPLSMLPAPLARLDARRGHSEWFVFNRTGLAKAVALAGFEVEAVTRILRDRPGPAVAREPLPAGRRARHAIGLLGRSAAVRGRAA
jgi:tRNA (mo5U34)-methyltransferase